jgi:hypothetical protein
MGASKGPQAPNARQRPGEAVALLDTQTGSYAAVNMGTGGPSSVGLKTTRTA